MSLVGGVKRRTLPGFCSCGPGRCGSPLTRLYGAISGQETKPDDGIETQHRPAVPEQGISILPDHLVEVALGVEVGIEVFLALGVEPADVLQAMLGPGRVDCSILWTADLEEAYSRAAFSTSAATWFSSAATSDWLWITFSWARRMLP